MSEFVELLRLNQHKYFTDVDFNSDLMKDEIFGPILPIHKVKSADEAIATVGRVKTDPLALFIFGRDRATIDKYIFAT